MYGAEEAQIGEKKAQFQFSVLSLFLQSIGVVLTDIQDIVFKSVCLHRIQNYCSVENFKGYITFDDFEQHIREFLLLQKCVGSDFCVIFGYVQTRLL